jgi:hypothetical protein
MTAYAAKIIISYSFIAGMQWLDLGIFFFADRLSHGFRGKPGSLQRLTHFLPGGTFSGGPISERRYHY